MRKPSTPRFRPARRHSCISAGCGARPRAQSASATRIMSRALPRRNSPRSARSPASRISRIWSSTMCRGRLLVESKSLKLYLTSFRNHGAFHEDCTVAIGKTTGRAAQAEMAAHRRLLVSARRHADRCVLAGGKIAEGRLGARTRASRPIAGAARPRGRCVRAGAARKSSRSTAERPRRSAASA